MEERIINLSYDIPEFIIGTKDERNPLKERKNLMSILLSNDVIDLNHVFKMVGGLAARKENVVCVVESTIIFASTKTLDEIAAILKPYQNQLYYVLTEVQEQPNTYLARIRANHTQQDKFNEELENLLSSMNN